MKCIRGSCFTIQNFLALVFFLMPAAAPAQSLADRSGQPSPTVQSSTEINMSLQQASDKLANSKSDAQPVDSRIGSDDLLDITVFEAPEMNVTVRVSASGEISLPLIGAVHAAGLTPKDLESSLQMLLRRTYMKDPHVGVFVHELQSHPVSVVGAVKSPGVFQIRGTKTVIEMLSMSGGLADDAGDEVIITHATERSEAMNSSGPDSSPPSIHVINLRKLLTAPDSSLNVPVHPGDIVKVPLAGIVYVVGEVAKPGGFVLQNNENISILQALALAQGLTHTSALRQARIIRTDPATGNHVEIPLNLGRVFSGKSPDTILQPKDIVFVPNSTAKSVLYHGSQAALQTAAGVAIYKW
jgi:polysaccharide export outer membrane protein